MRENPGKRAEQAYSDAQILRVPERSVQQDDLQTLSNNWKKSDVPALQRSVVNIQMENLRTGVVDPVFASFIAILQSVPLQSFDLLDAACASGYYSEVIKTLDRRVIRYSGCDYSEAMIQCAKQYYPEIDFQIQDLTSLTYADRSFDVLMVSGVLEHIPNYKKSISEICRVAKSYIIVHRCPLTSKKQHEYTVGSQYSIETPRIYFTKSEILCDFKNNGFRLQKEVSTYPAQSVPVLQQMKSRIKSVLGMQDSTNRTVKTFLFERAE